jgi:ribosomal protein S24E
MIKKLEKKLSPKWQRRVHFIGYALISIVFATSIYYSVTLNIPVDDSGKAKLIVILTGFIIAILKLEQIRFQHKQNHIWNRKEATMKVLNELRKIPNRNLISDLITNKTDGEAISADDVKEKINKSDAFKNAIGYTLNLYESIAIGCYYGIYDDELVNYSRYATLKRLRECYHLWIIEQRKTIPKFFTVMDELITHWEKNPSKRTPTDNDLG